MKMLSILAAALSLTAAFGAGAQTAFQRPDCSTYSSAFEPESKCIREVKKGLQQSNFAALQKTGLMFVHLARPDLDAHPDARKAIEDKVEGSFTVLFSVRADGTVYNVRTVEVIEGVAPLAEMWAETIGQWTFVEPGRDIADIEHRRIYMYSSDDDERKLHPDGN